MDRVFDTLKHIRRLWKELERRNPKTPEYDALMDKIRVLSAEYQGLIDAPKNPTNQIESLPAMRLHTDKSRFKSSVSHNGIASGKRGYRNVWSAAELQAKNDQWQLVCANVFGLWWSQ